MVSIKHLKESSRKALNKGMLGDKLMHEASFYLVKLLLYTKITPNQITIGGIFFGLIGVFLITFPSRLISMLGYIMMMLFWLSDYSDGKVARYRKMTSEKGKYYDYISHILISPLMFLGIGIHLFNISGKAIIILIGTFTALFCLWSDISPKFIDLIAGIKSEQSYLKVIRGKNKVSFKKILFKLHKTAMFNVHLFAYFLFAELISFFLLSLFEVQINLSLYLLIFFLIAFLSTFILQVFIIHPKRLDQ